MKQAVLVRGSGAGGPSFACFASFVSCTTVASQEAGGNAYPSFATVASQEAGGSWVGCFARLPSVGKREINIKEILNIA